MFRFKINGIPSSASELFILHQIGDDGLSASKSGTCDSPIIGPLNYNQLKYFLKLWLLLKFAFDNFLAILCLSKINRVWEIII